MELNVPFFVLAAGNNLVNLQFSKKLYIYFEVARVELENPEGEQAGGTAESAEERGGTKGVVIGRHTSPVGSA